MAGAALGSPFGGGEGLELDMELGSATIAADQGGKILYLPDGATIAWNSRLGKSPGAFFLPGFRSDMGGTKALALDAHCAAKGRAYVRFDYTGHGASSGRFEDGTIGRWRDDALAILDRVAEGPQILVGSSMGGWIALLLALARPTRVCGMVLIAPAPDFTDDLLLPALSPADRADLEKCGGLDLPSAYDERPTRLTRTLVEEARAHLLLRGPIPIGCPVRILQGMCDPDVPWQRALLLAERLATANLALTLLKDGDHRLSRPEDLARLCAAVEELAAN
jgi:pimeloyl-ACP methyl ester carboxylesterase